MSLITFGYAPKQTTTIPAGIVSGSIIIQPKNAQLIAIPKEGGKVYQDFVRVVELKYNVSASLLFEACNAYPSTNLQNNEFLSFIPGVTNQSTKHNFDLVVNDNGVNEIVGFWVISKNYIENGVLNNNIVFEWDISNI